MPRKRSKSLKAPDKPRAGDVRQREIMELMADGNWTPGIDNLRLEEKYDCAPATIKKDAEFAARMLRLYAGDTDDIRTLLVANVAAIRREALAAVRTEKRWNRKTAEWDKLEMPAPDFSSALKSLELQARLLGLTPNRVELITTGDELEGWEQSELEEYTSTARVPKSIIERYGMNAKQVAVFEQAAETIDTEGTEK